MEHVPFPLESERELLPGIAMVSLHCTACARTEICTTSDMLQRLQTLGMLRREETPSVELVSELFASKVDRFRCLSCSAVALVLQEQGEDDELWDDSRNCEVCGKPIPPARIEVFPESYRCVKCQGAQEKGQSSDEPEFCAHCGSILELRQRRGSGLAGYAMFCPSCRRR